MVHAALRVYDAWAANTARSKDEKQHVLDCLKSACHDMGLLLTSSASRSVFSIPAILSGRNADAAQEMRKNTETWRATHDLKKLLV